MAVSGSFESIVAEAPPVFAASQLRVILRALVNLDPYTFADDLAEDSHIYNPKWPPHAKFHDGQTLSLSILLGGLTTFLAWKSSRNVPMMVAFTGAAASLYFVSQDAASLYPGTSYSDSERKPTVLGIPAVHVIDGVYLSAVAAATWLGLRHRRADAATSSL